MLYLEHFGLDEPPFRITPHTDFFFDGADRGATLEALLYAILHDEGIVKVSGEVGSGKTMLCRVLMERLPEHVEIVYLANPSLAQDDILYAIADDLRVEFAEGERLSVMLKSLLGSLIDLYSEGRRVVLLIDEAHAMPEATLEQVRLLSNLESNRHKLLQIVLFGQPELDAVLDKFSMRQLKDRITHSFRMRPLSEIEIGKYLSFRMRAAGYRGPDVFGARAVAKLAKAAKGLTRRVNILADKALLAAFTRNTHAVTVREVRTAIRDSDFGRLLNEKQRNPALFAATALVVGLAIGAAVHWVLTSDATEPHLSGRPVHDARSSSGALATKSGAPVPSPGAASSPKVSQVGSIDAKTVDRGPMFEQAQGTPPVPASSVPATAVSIPEVKSAPSSVPGPLLSPESLERLAGYRTDAFKLLKQRVAATMDMLAKEPDSSFTIELFATDNSDPARTQRFLLRARDLVSLDEVYVVPQPAGKGYRIRVLFGRFQNQEGAARGVDALPPKYKSDFQVNLRSFAEVRAAL